jgi:hypothetical protein
MAHGGISNHTIDQSREQVAADASKILAVRRLLLLFPP